MTGAGGVVALVMLEWVTGWLGCAAWTQSWSVVKRGHFRIMAWVATALATLAFLANRAALGAAMPASGPLGPAAAAPSSAELQRSAVVLLLGAAVVYLLVQWSRTDVPGVAAGGLAALAGALALGFTSDLIAGWPDLLAGLHLLAGAALLGSVTNGMMLGHWYLNQPGLQPWALARLTQLALGAVAASLLLGVVGAGPLASASTEGAVLGVPGFGDDLAGAFYAVWLTMVLFTGAVVWGARRCVKIRSIQSATGLYYVAILTAGVAEFLVRYLMVNAA